RRDSCDFHVGLTPRRSPEMLGGIAVNPNLLTPVSPSLPATAPRKPPRGWCRNFADALRALPFGIQGQSSFCVPFFIPALLLAAATVLRCPIQDWIILLLCIGMVLTAELFNSAMETLFHGLDERTKSRCWKALDIAAAAVLVASITAAVVGVLVFLHRLG